MAKKKTDDPSSAEEGASDAPVSETLEERRARILERIQALEVPPAPTQAAATQPQAIGEVYNSDGTASGTFYSMDDFPMGSSASSMLSWVSAGAGSIMQASMMEAPAAIVFPPVSPNKGCLKQEDTKGAKKHVAIYATEPSDRYSSIRSIERAEKDSERTRLTWEDEEEAVAGAKAKSASRGEEKARRRQEEAEIIAAQEEAEFRNLILHVYDADSEEDIEYLKLKLTSFLLESLTAEELAHLELAIEILGASLLPRGAVTLGHSSMLTLTQIVEAEIAEAGAICALEELDAALHATLSFADLTELFLETANPEDLLSVLTLLANANLSGFLLEYTENALREASEEKKSAIKNAAKVILEKAVCDFQLSEDQFRLLEVMIMRRIETDLSSPEEAKKATEELERVAEALSEVAAAPQEEVAQAHMEEDLATHLGELPPEEAPAEYVGPGLPLLGEDGIGYALEHDYALE